MPENIDQDRFLKHFLPNRDKLYAYVRIMVPDPETAEDVLQEVSIVLWRKFDTFEVGTSFSAWARKIALNLVRNLHRKLAKAPVLISPEVSEAVAGGLERLESNGEDEWRMALETCMARLSPSARQVVELRYFDRLGLLEIAERLERTSAGVNSALRKARLFLESCIMRTLRRRETA